MACQQETAKKVFAKQLYLLHLILFFSLFLFDAKLNEFNELKILSEKDIWMSEKKSIWFDFHIQCFDHHKEWVKLRAG